MGEAQEWERQHRRRPGRLLVRVLAAACAAVVLVVVARGVHVPRSPAPAPHESALEVGSGEDTRTPTPAPLGAWTPTAPAPPELGRVGASVWTGEEVLVVGADRHPAAWTYAPSTGLWRRVADPPLGLDGGIWDGHRAHFLVADDAAGDALEVVSWDRADERWRRSPPAPSPPRRGAMVAADPADGADGTRIWVVGGRTTEGTRRDGVVLADGGWSPLPELDIGPRRNGSAIWTGTELLVFGGIDGGGRWRSDGAVLEPDGDAWRPIARPPVPFAVDPAVVWTDDGLVVWSLAPAAPERVDGWRYDPRADRWSAPPQPSDEDRVTARAAAREGVLAVWGGRSFDPESRPRLTPRTDGVLLRLDDGASRRLPEAPLPPRSGALVVLTDVGLLVWGGQGRSDGALLPTPAVPGPADHRARLSPETLPPTMDR